MTSIQTAESAAPADLAPRPPQDAIPQSISAAERAQLREVAARMYPPRTPIGFPASTDIDFTAIAPLTPGTLNNIGDPMVPGLEHRNVKDLERAVVTILADLFRAPQDDRWGCVTTGGTEGNLHGLLVARTRLPDGVVYFASSAHYSVPKAVHLLSLEAVRVPADDRGELDYTELAGAVREHFGRPVIVVATVGTTMTEAVDDVARIRQVLDELQVPERLRHIHVDAALTGMPLALSARAASTRHPSLDLSDEVDSLSISGHKFLATPEPCGVLITRGQHRDRVAQSVSYIGGADATIPGSRSGHTVLQLWWALHHFDLAEHHQRAERARAVAAYTVDRLQEIGWSAWRHPHAFTVVLRSPSPTLIHRWSLANQDGWSHIVCVPGLTTKDIDEFLTDLAATDLAPLAVAAACA